MWPNTVLVQEEMKVRVNDARRDTERRRLLSSSDGAEGSGLVEAVTNAWHRWEEAIRPWFTRPLDLGPECC